MGIMEACWLAAVLLVPMFAHPYTAGFQASKAFLLRTLGILGVAAWLMVVMARCVSTATSEKRRADKRWRPVLAAIAAMLVAHGIANIFSISPATSFFGSPGMAMGSVTYVSGLALLCLAAFGLRRWEQVDRLVTAIIAGSLPVALYAIVQALDLDPLIFEANEGRVHSFVGHPIFLAGYLLMVMPLTLFRIMLARAALRARDGGAFSGRAAVSFYWLLLGVQCAAFFFAKSRGPLLALLVVIGCLAIGLAVRFQRRRLVLGVLVGGVAVLATLAALGYAKRSGAQWASNATIARFSSALPFAEGPDGFRASLWKSAPRMMLGAEPLPFPTGGADRWHRWRPLVGFGPETLDDVLSHFWTVPSASGQQENRFHSLVWDKWASEGAIGVAALLGFVLVVFRLGYGTLGFIGEPGGGRRFYLFAAGGALSGTAVACLAGGGGYASLGLIIGLVAGLWTYPLLSLRKTTAATPRDRAPGQREILVIALLAALSGHLVETSFAFEVITTFTLFLIFAALVIALALSFQESSQTATADQGLLVEPQPSSLGDHTASGELAGPAMCRQRHIHWLLVSSALVTLMFDFLHGYFRQPVSLGGFLSQAMMGMAGDRGASHLIPLLLIPSWLGMSFIMATSGSGRSGPVAWLWISIPSFAIAVVFCLVQGGVLARLGVLPRDGDSPAGSLAQCAGFESASVGYLLLIIVLVIALGIACAQERALKGCPPRHALACAAVGAGALLLCWYAAFMPLRAEVAEGWGLALRSLGKAQHIAGNLRRAVMLNPQPSLYRRQLAWTLADLGESTEPGSKQSPVSEAENLLVAAQDRSRGLDVATFQLAGFYFRLAAIEQNLESKSALARKAAEAFDRAVIYQPGSAIIWFDSAINDRLHLGREEAAANKFATARAITADHVPEGWGDSLRQRIATARSPEVAAEYTKLALDYYDMALAKHAGSLPDSTRAHFGKGVIRAAANDPEGALPDLLLAIVGDPIPETWQAEFMLAQIYAGRRNAEDAQRHLASAIRQAPATSRGELMRLHQQLFGTAP